MSAQAGTESDGPVAQSVRIGARALQIVTALLAAGWVTANLRPVPPEQQAVVLRLGRVVRVQPSGLVLALPQPVEQVVLLPGPEQQVALPLAVATARLPGIEDAASRALGETIPVSTGAYLTGDGGVVLLDATVSYRVSDAAAYFLAQSHVAPALRRLFMAAAGAVAGGRRLDDFVAVRQERAGDPDAQAQREAVRGELVGQVNRRLGALAGQGAGLGVEVTRADVTALLPPAAKPAFDAVLQAAQMAYQGAADARTEAARLHQAADRDRDRLLAEASAAAAERVGDARARTAPILALERQADPATRPSLLDQAYRERIATVLRSAGSVTAVDGHGSRIILPGTLAGGTP